MKRVPLLSSLSLLLGAVMFSTACGGGGGGSKTAGPVTSNVTPASVMTITTPSILPSTITGHTYSTTLTATGGSGALHWSIAPISPTALFVTGLTIDAASGVLSGTANFGGTGGFTATVTDSSSPALTATKGFTITAGATLTAGPDLNLSQSLFTQVFPPPLGVQGGAPPLSYSLLSGSLPPGIHINSSGVINGGPYLLGTYQATISIQDSLGESVSQKVTFHILPAPIKVGGNIPSRIAVNVPFDGMIGVAGGTPPYTFSTPPQAGLPTGLTLDPATGRLSGTPTVSDRYMFFVSAADSGNPQLSAGTMLDVTVGPTLGRNDTPATATPISSFVNASISPYIDPPNTAPLPADNDYYRIVAAPGTVVHVETFAKRNTPFPNLLDTVIEILDVNGHSLSSCRQPGDSTNNFTSICLNDDISASPHVQDSALDLQVPTSAQLPPTYIIHVFDWSGNARPDMTYGMQVTGAVPPIVIYTTRVNDADRGLNYTSPLAFTGGSGTLTWTVSSGALPPGLSLSPAGTISGTPTTDGNYPFTAQVTDSVGQTASHSYQINVVERITITSSGTLPDACLNKPYVFAVQTSGGSAPFSWGLNSNMWVGINPDSTGTLRGTPTVLGTFMGTLFVSDSTGASSQLPVTLKVVNDPVTCP